MSELDQVIRESVANEDVPFLVGMVGNSGGVVWSGAAGERSPGQPATVDTVFRIFSMTKAVGSTAAMILIDRGKLSADTVVETILPEFAELKVLEGFDDKRPRLRAPRTKATVRHLATHTSGLVYEFWNTEVPRYMVQFARAVTGFSVTLTGRPSRPSYRWLSDHAAPRSIWLRAANVSLDAAFRRTRTPQPSLLPIGHIEHRRQRIAPVEFRDRCDATFTFKHLLPMTIGGIATYFGILISRAMSRFPCSGVGCSGTVDASGAAASRPQALHRDRTGFPGTGRRQFASSFGRHPCGVRVILGTPPRAPVHDLFVHCRRAGFEGDRDGSVAQADCRRGVRRGRDRRAARR